jgi:rubrerythrin
MELKGSQTEINLMKTFAGESQARNRYTYSASKAREEGYIQIAEIFIETADHEREHAKRFFGLMQGGEIEITACFPAGPIGATLDNLRHAAAGENHEWTELYPGFAAVARREGIEPAARLWDAVCIAEKQHEKRYKQLADNVERGIVFVRDHPVVWRCRNCGYVHEGPEAPKACPACAHPMAHFELLGENW